jgi:metallo-beta-lactamase class B
MNLLRIAFTLLFGLGILYCSAQTPLHKLDITHLEGNFYVFTTYKDLGGNPFPSNGLYCVTAEGVLLLDTPWDSTQFGPLLDSIALRHGKTVRMCISTHSHDDRTAGLEYFREKKIATYSSALTRRLCLENGEKLAESVFLQDTIFRLGGVELQTYYPGPGHAPDNIVVWFPAARILYGGCLVKSKDAKGLGNLADADKAHWPKAIQAVQAKFPKPRWIIPGHGKWSSRASLKHTLYLLKQSE